MSTKFDEIYNQVLRENAIPAANSTPSGNISKEVQDFFSKHQTSPGFFDELVKQLDAAQKAQKSQQPTQPASSQQTPVAGQQQNASNQPAQQNTQQPQQTGTQSNQQQQTNQQQKKI